MTSDYPLSPRASRHNGESTPPLIATTTLFFALTESPASDMNMVLKTALQKYEIQVKKPQKKQERYPWPSKVSGDRFGSALWMGRKIASGGILERIQLNLWQSVSKRGPGCGAEKREVHRVCGVQVRKGTRNQQTDLLPGKGPSQRETDVGLTLIWPAASPGFRGRLGGRHRRLSDGPGVSGSDLPPLPRAPSHSDVPPHAVPVEGRD